MPNTFTSLPKQGYQINQEPYSMPWSNSFSTTFGRVTPVRVDRMPEKSSISFVPRLALQMMPIQFPIQSRIVAKVSYWKIPIRTLWRDYQNWYTGVDKTLVPPFMNPHHDVFNSEEKFKKYFGTGSLADYLGLPTTYDVAPADTDMAFLGDFLNPNLSQSLADAGGAAQPVSDYAFMPARSADQVDYTQDSFFFTGRTLDSALIKHFLAANNNSYVGVMNLPLKMAFRVSLPTRQDALVRASQIYRELFRGESRLAKCGFSIASKNGAKVKNFYNISSSALDFPEFDALEPEFSEDGLGSVTVRYVFDVVVKIPMSVFSNFLSTDTPCLVSWMSPIYQNPNSSTIKYVAAFDFYNRSSALAFLTGEYTRENCPWKQKDNDKSGRVPVSSYPLRAYNAVYNCYLRDYRNDPFIVGGKEIYNRWIANFDYGGAETTSLGKAGVLGSQTESYFDFKYSNWEKDPYTSALQMPIQAYDPANPGRVPLVGLTNYASSVTQADGSVRHTLNSTIRTDDGHLLKAVYDSDEDGLKSVRFTEVTSVSDLGQPVSTLYDAVTQGIAIDDFRNVNCLTRYLEMNNRVHYRYKDMVETRFDVNLKYDDFLMPEYLGGFTRDVNINAITQNMENNGGDGSYVGALGSQAGIGYISGEGQRISVFADEECILLGLCIIQPMPIYTQNLPKHFLYETPFDSYKPEFAKLSYQPIKLSELCPIQAYAAEGAAGLDKTFGYQRPWYEYLWKYDEAHGLFRDQLRNFMLHRVFSGVPALNAKFLHVDPKQLSQVFSVTEFSDKVFGMVYYSEEVHKLPIPRSVIPRLE